MPPSRREKQPRCCESQQPLQILAPRSIQIRPSGLPNRVARSEAQTAAAALDLHLLSLLDSAFARSILALCFHASAPLAPDHPATAARGRLPFGARPSHRTGAFLLRSHWPASARHPIQVDV